ncbi:MAG: DegV family protein [Dehalococcoidales bacterium]|nr:DegV family protein [Dehalococcoidales bacterium]
MPDIAVMTDTVSYCPAEIASKYKILQAPVHILMDGESYPENEIDLVQFYKKIPKWKEEEKLPTTSSPSPDDFVSAYRKLSKEHESIIYIGYSEHLGMAVKSALLAKELVKDELSKTKIEIIDSKSWGGAQMMITLELTRANAAGSTLKELLVLADDMIKKVNLIILSDNLYYLAKGGRIHKARPWANSKVSNTALLKLDASTEGKTSPIARCRTKGETLKTLFDMVRGNHSDSRLHFAINHADALAEAEQMKEELLAQFRCEEVFISNIGPLVTIHTGLGTRVLSWWAE